MWICHRRSNRFKRRTLCKSLCMGFSGWPIALRVSEPLSGLLIFPLSQHLSSVGAWFVAEATGSVFFKKRLVNQAMLTCRLTPPCLTWCMTDKRGKRVLPEMSMTDQPPGAMKCCFIRTTWTVTPWMSLLCRNNQAAVSQGSESRRRLQRFPFELHQPLVSSHLSPSLRDALPCLSNRGRCVPVCTVSRVSPHGLLAC